MASASGTEGSQVKRRKIAAASGDDGSQNQVKRCFFGNHLLSTSTALTELMDCDDNHAKFLELDDLELRETIMARSCIKYVAEDATICATHKTALGPRYYEVISGNKKCMWPHHGPKRTVKGLREAFPERNGDVRKQSLYLFTGSSIRPNVRCFD